ncbi:ATP synthase delta chain [Citrifermentans bremense]|uniref:ATP synthase subunit delta n=1 Tax=Citrifermentans bremense TaxID=60035 RepID=A0A6S6M5L5_9BACT|nr:ATP synthase F1 subunit delta [Citrifermentans bremense]BCG49088.1 ATP synthase delta chain [Citrifermentans bremense]
MSTNAIAKRYAKALVQIGSEAGSVEGFNGELNRFSTLLTESRELGAIFGNPAYGIDEKKGILKDLVAKASISPMISNLLMLLLERGRLMVLPQIAESYGVYADELSGVIRPTLSSGLPLDAAQIEEIKGALAKSTGKKVELKVVVDPSLIGGVVTQIGDKVFDGSVRTQLANIQDILQKG